MKTPQSINKWMPELIVVYNDATKLAKLDPGFAQLSFKNLVSNAFKLAIKKRGINIEISEENIVKSKVILEWFPQGHIHSQVELAIGAYLYCHCLADLMNVEDCKRILKSVRSRMALDDVYK